MRTGPIRRRGLLHAVRRHPVTRLSALFALLTYLLAGLSPLWVPAIERSGIEICTAGGLQVVPGDLPYPDTPAGQKSAKRTCPLCTIHAAYLLPPAERAIAPLGRAPSAVVHPDPAATFAGLFAGFDHLSRAPPVLS